MLADPRRAGRVRADARPRRREGPHDEPRLAHADPRDHHDRPDPRPADPGQPARQRDQVHRVRLGRARGGNAHRGARDGGRVHRHGLRDRHVGGAGRAAVHAVHAGRRHHDPPIRRDRPRADDHPALCPAARRPHRGPQRAGQGQHVPRLAADRPAGRRATLDDVSAQLREPAGSRAGRATSANGRSRVCGSCSPRTDPTTRSCSRSSCRSSARRWNWPETAPRPWSARWKPMRPGCRSTSC